MSSLNFKPIILAGWACQEGRIGTICWQGYNLFTRPTGDVETRGHALLSAASFMRGLPMFPRHSQSSQEYSAFFFCKNAAPPKSVSCPPLPSCWLAAPSKAKWKGSCWLPQPPATTPENMGLWSSRDCGTSSCFRPSSIHSCELRLQEALWPDTYFKQIRSYFSSSAFQYWNQQLCLWAPFCILSAPSQHWLKTYHQP